VRFALDSNILVYAFFDEEPAKHAMASAILTAADLADCILPAQAIGEFLNVVRRKEPRLLEPAEAQARRWLHTFETGATRGPDIVAAAALSREHKLQFWDSVIWQVTRAAGAEILLSEDMQDGLRLEGMRVLNPFLPKNRDLLDAQLRPLDA
jgi:predicted nucleic acid-binding protein